MTADKKKLAPLLPDRYPQRELFLCDVSDAVIKGDQASLEHPVFSLSKKPDMEVKIYENNGNTLQVIPSFHGHATIYDKDVLTYAVSKIMQAKKEGKEISPNVVFEAQDALKFMNRSSGGREYRALEKALMRLQGTQLKTDIKTGDEIQTDIFGLLDRAKIHRKHGDGRVLSWGVTVSDWVFNAIVANEVLTLHPQYFRLRRPIDKRIYEIARKHCGNQKQWSISLELLKKKSGWVGTIRLLRGIVRGLAESQHLPDYNIAIDDRDMVLFTNHAKQEQIAATTAAIRLKPDTYEIARREAPTWDVYHLENLWRSWINDGGLEIPKYPDKAFLGFCRRYYQRNGDA